MSLIEALAVVKAAGYRVTKPKPKRVKDRVGPTFVAEFADGEVTRMSTYTSLENLDVDRGMRLSHAAYESRWRRVASGRPADIVCHVPQVVSAHFEQDGAILASYEAGEWIGLKVA